MIKTMFKTKIVKSAKVRKAIDAAKKVEKRPMTIAKSSSLMIAHIKKPVSRKSIKNSSKIFHNQYIGKKELHSAAVKKIEQIWRIMNDYSEQLKNPLKNLMKKTFFKGNAALKMKVNDDKKTIVQELAMNKIANKKSISKMNQVI